MVAKSIFQNLSYTAATGKHLNKELRNVSFPLPNNPNNEITLQANGSSFYVDWKEENEEEEEK